MTNVGYASAAAMNVDANSRQPLVEKYRPRHVNEFIGLSKLKRTISEFVLQPFQSNWLFTGPPGVGKTSMGYAIAREIHAQLHHVPAKACDLQRVETLCSECQYVPCNDWKPARFHLCLIDEADAISHAAQIAFLSLLDGTMELPNTIIVFTANSDQRLEPRFRSRCRILGFTTEGIAEEIAQLLRGIWAKESRDHMCPPDFAKIVADSESNVRSALHRLEIEMLSASSPSQFGAPPSVQPGVVSVSRFRESMFIGSNANELPTELHPLAEIMPRLPPQEFAALKKDIAERGVKVPILLYQGKILDGKERVRACKELGVGCPFVDYSGRDPLSMILSLNLARRHLNESQRALVAARIANIGHGGDRRHTDQDAKLRVDQIAVRQAAQRLNVSSRSVEAAKKVLREGGPDLIAAINSGKMSVSKAAKSIVRSRTGVKPLSPSRKKLAPPKLDDAKDSARWLWDEIISLGQSGILDRPPADLFSEMTESERAEILRVAPTLVSWLRRFGECAFRHSQAIGRETGL